MSEESPRTISEYLSDISPLLTEGDIRVILRRRNIAPDYPVDDLSEKELDLT